MRLVLTLACCVGIAAAQDAKDFVEAARTALEHGHADFIAEALAAGYGETLAEDPTLACELAAAAARHARKYAAGRADIWRRLADGAVGVGVLVTEKHEGNADALACRGEALFCRARVAQALGEKPRAEDWRDAVEFLVKAHAADASDGKHLASAIRVAVEGARLPGADPALAGREEELCALAEKQGTRGPELRALLHARAMARIGELLKTDRKEAKRLIQGRFETLEPLLKGKDPPMAEATAYNDLVTLVRGEKGLGLKTKYVTQTVASGRNLLEFDLPISTRWAWRTGDLGALSQYDTEGALLRTIDFDTYRWDVAYSLDGVEFGGDNLQGLARLGEQDAESVFVQVKDRKAVQRRRFNGRIPQCQTFEMSGRDEEGSFRRFRCYYFKGKEARLTTFRITILETDAGAANDPEFEAVLDSIREIKGR
jgi:hypothetical protein